MTIKGDLKPFEEKYRPLIIDPLEFVKIDHGNYKPDIFTVGPKHISYASANCGGILNDEVTEKVPCERCHKPMSQHTHDTVLFVNVTRKCTKAEIQAVLTPEFGKMLGDDGIDGVGFPKGFDLIEKASG